jgi:hypothetical protein
MTLDQAAAEAAFADWVARYRETLPGQSVAFTFLKLDHLKDAFLAGFKAGRAAQVDLRGRGGGETPGAAGAGSFPWLLPRPLALPLWPMRRWAWPGQPAWPLVTVR